MQTLFEDTLGTLTLEDWMRHMGATVGSVLPEDTRVTFQVEGDGGGTWTLVRTFKGWELHQGAATWPDATLSCTLPRFMDLVSGRIDARRAFLDGSVEVEGDVGLLLRLHQALPAA